MEPLDYITIGSAVLNFLLGGTTVWSIIQWLSEKKLRKIGSVLSGHTGYQRFLTQFPLPLSITS